MGYRHLTIDERESILKISAEQKNMTEMARLLGRSKGTISRELARNSSQAGVYRAYRAQRYYAQRRKDSKQPYRLEQNRRLQQYVGNKLKQYWSPEQIAGRLKRAYPHVPQMHLSPSTIYSWLKRNKAAGGGLYPYLRQGLRARRNKYGSRSQRGKIPARRPISQRPAVVEPRIEPGHWEGDSMVGKSHGSFIATHVERLRRSPAGELVLQGDHQAGRSRAVTCRALLAGPGSPRHGWLDAAHIARSRDSRLYPSSGEVLLQIHVREHAQDHQNAEQAQGQSNRSRVPRAPFVVVTRHLDTIAHH